MSTLYGREGVAGRVGEGLGARGRAAQAAPARRAVGGRGRAARLSIWIFFSVWPLPAPRRTRLERGEGRGVSDQYGVRDAACPISTG